MIDSIASRVPDLQNVRNKRPHVGVTAPVYGHAGTIAVAAEIGGEDQAEWPEERRVELRQETIALTGKRTMESILRRGKVGGRSPPGRVDNPVNIHRDPGASIA